MQLSGGLDPPAGRRPERSVVLGPIVNAVSRTRTPLAPQGGQGLRTVRPVGTNDLVRASM
jgi:hypothetical protein